MLYNWFPYILIVKTSFGKSMMLQAVFIFLDKMISIIILSLDQIRKEQAEKIARIGGQPCFLNFDTISNLKLLEDIGNGKYTHVLMSPGPTVSDRLRKVILERSYWWLSTRVVTTS
jgi:hypothetical protein